MKTQNSDKQQRDSISTSAKIREQLVFVSVHKPRQLPSIIIMPAPQYMQVFECSREVSRLSLRGNPLETTDRIDSVTHPSRMECGLSAWRGNVP